VCKKLIKNSQPFGKNFQKTVGGGFFFDSHCRSRTPCVQASHHIQPMIATTLYFISTAMNASRKSQVRELILLRRSTTSDCVQVTGRFWMQTM